jgi:pyruvate,water dikinase
MAAESAARAAEPAVLDLFAVEPGDQARAGGKAVALATMRRHGLQVPGGLCVLTHAYDRFVDSAGLRRAVALELGRKAFEDMRWEEIWDASLRIRNLFLRASIEPTLGGELEDALRRRFWDGRAAVVRSSAPAEDTASTSFAGLHESYVDVRGVAALVDAVRRVWASLWTDRALLYRQELGLDVMESSMAVVVQELVSGQVSGVAFSRNPLEESQAVVESVWGLNEGLVDGTIEPDRWIIDRPRVTWWNRSIRCVVRRWSRVSHPGRPRGAVCGLKETRGRMTAQPPARDWSPSVRRSRRRRL